MANGLSIHHVIESAIILHVIGCLLEHTLQVEALLHPQVLAFAAFRQLDGFLQRFFRVEQSRLVHVVPEAFNSRIQQLEVLPAKPCPHLRAQKIRKITMSRPHRPHKGLPVCLEAEIALLQPLIAHVVALFLFHPSVNDGHQTDMLLPHVPRQLRQVVKIVLVPGEILEAFHVINIHAYAVQGNMPGTMFPNDGADFLLRGITPPGLNIAKRPLRRQVALPDDAAEGMHNALQAILFHQIHADVTLRAGDDRLVAVRVAKVERHVARIVEIHAEKAAFPRKDQQIMASIQALPSLM